MGRFIIEIIFWIVLSFIVKSDFKEKIVPDKMTLSILLLGVVKIIFFQEDIENKIIGMGTYPVIFLLLYGYGEFLFKKEVVGFGDIKLLSSIGFYTGYLGIYSLMVFYNIIFSFSLFYGLIYKFYFKNNEVPFAPVIVIGTFIFYFLQGNFI